MLILPEARLRLAEFRFTRTQAGVCSAEVELEAADGTRVIGRAHGASSPTGDLRVAADAALRAVEAGLPDGLRFDLVGVKSLRAFDASIVIVAVVTRRLSDAAHLLGCFLAGDDINRGAVIAVLNATNRVLGGGVRH